MCRIYTCSCSCPWQQATFTCKAAPCSLSGRRVSPGLRVSDQIEHRLCQLVARFEFPTSLRSDIHQLASWTEQSRMMDQILPCGGYPRLGHTKSRVKVLVHASSWLHFALLLCVTLLAVSSFWCFPFPKDRSYSGTGRLGSGVYCQ